MSDHTPGPWRVIGERRSEYRHETEPADLVISSDYGIVADVSGLCYGEGRRPSEDTVEANASLIAAAPELYEAAKAYLAAIEQSADNGHYPPTLLTDDDRFPDGTEMLRDALAKAEGE